MHLHAGLAVRGRGEGLGLGRRYGGVPVDQGRGDAAQRLDAEGEGCDVQQEDVGHVTLEHTGLDGCAGGNHLVRVDSPVRLLVEKILDPLHYGRHAGHASYHDHLVDLVAGEAGVSEGLAARGRRAFDEVADQLLQLGAGEVHRQVLGAGGVRGDERQVDLGLYDVGELHLGLLGGLLEALEGHAVLLEIDALLAAELLADPVDYALVEVVTAEEGIAVGGLDLEHALADLEDGDIERSAAQVVHRDGLVALVFQAVCHGGGGRLVDDAKDVQPGYPAGVLGGLSLAVVEVGGNGDDGLRDTLSQLGLRVLLKLLEDHGRNLRRGVGLSGHGHLAVAVGRPDHLVWKPRHGLLNIRVVVTAAHEPLDREYSVLWVGDGLALGNLARVALAGVGVDGYDRGGHACAFAVL